jgi:hypothetical protein
MVNGLAIGCGRSFWVIQVNSLDPASLSPIFLPAALILAQSYLPRVTILMTTQSTAFKTGLDKY